MRCPAFLAPVLSLLLAGCTGFAETETQTFTLRPDRMQVADLLHENRSGVCVGVPRHGTASRLFEEWQEGLPADADPKLLVGYSSVLLRGESCDTWLHHVFQGLMDFDLRGLPERGAITDATLRYDSSTFLPDGSTAAGYDTTCLYEVGEVTEEWRTRALSAAGSPDIFRGSREDLIAARPISVEGARAARTAVDVTAAVNRWRTGARPNLGFAFTPREADRFVERTLRCARRAIRIRLDVTMQVPVEG